MDRMKGLTGWELEAARRQEVLLAEATDRALRGSSRSLLGALRRRTHDEALRAEASAVGEPRLARS